MQCNHNNALGTLAMYRQISVVDSVVDSFTLRQETDYLSIQVRDSFYSIVWRNLWPTNPTIQCPLNKDVNFQRRCGNEVPSTVRVESELQ